MTEIDPGNPYSPHKSWNNRTEREELIEIILRWLKSSRPDDSDIPSVLADSILEWHKKHPVTYGYYNVEIDTYNGGSVSPEKGRMKEAKDPYMPHMEDTCDVCGKGPTKYTSGPDTEYCSIECLNRKEG